MTTSFAEKPHAHKNRLWLSLALIIIGIACAIVVSLLLIGGAMSESKREIALAAVIAALPVMLYLAVAKPIVFPLGLYALLVPFDNLLALDPRYGTVTKLVAILAGFALVFSIIRHRRVTNPGQATYVWLAVLVWMALSVFWALDSGTAVEKLTTYAELIVLYAAISAMPIKLAEFKVFAGAVVLGSLVASAYAIYLFRIGVHVQHLEIAQQFASRVFVKSGETRIDPNAFGTALLFPLSLVLMLTLQRRWLLAKLGLSGLVLILLSGIYVTGSRGAMVGLVTLMGYLVLRSRYKLQMLVVSVVGLGATFLISNPFARFGNAIATGGAGRVSIWKVGWTAFKEHWLLGAGVGNFPYAYDKSFISTYTSYYAHWHRVAHNVPLTLAVELGIIGLSLGLLAWYLQWRSLRFIRESDPLFDLRISLEGALLGLFMGSLFLSNLEDKYLWLGFALMGAARSLAMGRTRNNIPDRSYPTIVNGERTFDRGLRPKVPEHA